MFIQERSSRSAIKEALEQKKAEYMADMVVIEAIIKAIDSYTGKSWNLRLETHLNAKLPECHVSMTKTLWDFKYNFTFSAKNLFFERRFSVYYIESVEHLKDSMKKVLEGRRSGMASIMEDLDNVDEILQSYDALEDAARKMEKIIKSSWVLNEHLPLTK